MRAGHDARPKELGKGRNENGDYGLADGFAKGHEDGYAAGCDDGANDTPRATYDETNNFVGRKERQDYVRGYREGYAVGLEDGVSEQQFGI